MENKIKNITYVSILIALLITLLITGKSILLPAAWALLFAFIGLPLAYYLESKKMRRTTAALVATLTTIILLGFMFAFLFIEASNIISNQDDLYEKLISNSNAIIEQLESRFGVELKSKIQGNSSNNLVNLLASEIIALGKNLVTLTLIPMYMFFIINYRGLIRKFIDKRYEGIVREQVISFVSHAKLSVTNYLKGTLILTGLVTLISYLIFLIFGVKYALFFALFIAILNLIPYIGNLIGLIIVLMFTFLSKDSLNTTLFVGIALYVSHMVQENFLRPKLLGDKMEMNAAVVFTAALAGGVIWGVSGMILFIPFTGIVKSFVDNNPRWKSFGVFFGI